MSSNAQHLASHLRPRSRRQYVIAAVVALVLVGGGGWWFLGRADGAEAESITATVSAGTFQQTVTGSGTIQPAREADLDFEVSGRVTSVKVKAGDTVAKGDVVATLDTASLDAALASAKAQLEAAETTVANDSSESSTQQASNSAALLSAQADVTQAKDDLAAATLRATFSGTVASVDVAVGDQAGSSSSGSADAGGQGGTGAATGGDTSAATTSTAAVTIVQPRTFVVDADVAADDITQVKKGLQVQITPTGATTPIFGTVKEVGLVAETGTSGAATFPVTVSVTGAQKDLYAGTSADISIVVKQVQNVLTVPTLALTTTNGKTYVTKVVGSSTKKTAVTVGETYGASTQITKGLKSGDKVEITTIRRSPTGTTNRGTRGEGGFGEGGFPGGGAPPNLSGGGFPGGAQ
ncbi:biotin/lipoyl-binding protein [Aeromicrobium ginsengisoli]|uniref:Biotin/lipoyl-binding protein n=1 Tax=Aeromicrobium ginsengisoli TaxID=363867 RepID=A0A5M4FJS3_9ACTN|nr:biotin/lipoyl-binding protein [Aeromicrobium ginsengisoli]